jgi:CARDB
MKRALTLAGAVAVLGSVAGAAAAATPPRASLRNFICQHALDPAARAVSLRAVMRPVAGTKKMQLRFQLVSRARTVSMVSGGDLGTWINPGNPTLGQRRGDVWILNKQVVNLAAPATYRFRVSFRWIGSRGHVLGVSVKESQSCFQPELRPDLSVDPIAVQPVPNRPKVDRYVVTIRNHGATAAGGFEVLFTPGGSLPVKTANVPGLGAHKHTQVSFIGPLCTSTSAPTVTVDPNDAVDDFNRANNSATALC